MSSLPTSSIGYQEDLAHPVPAPGLLWLFGETGKGMFYSVNTPDSDPEAKRVKVLFPEAKILQVL